MRTIGVICEYNPLHLGHKKQLSLIRRRFGEDTRIVCLMSGNFVQRGHPAIFDRMARAKAAVACGADLVLELPVTHALSSAEGFAAGGVAILDKICDGLCFGAETADETALLRTARILLSEDFSAALRVELEQGLSFPAARQAALCALGLEGEILATPNNILAVEYCKAILAQNSALTPLPIHRGGSYHDAMPDPENPSATSLRQQILHGGDWSSFVPTEALPYLQNAPIHDLSGGEKAILARLRTMTDAEFEALPYGSEGLWRKLMRASRKEPTLDAILSAAKSKRYTRTRLDRMVLCAFLGLAAEDLSEPAPYCRVLAFNDTGRSILSEAKDSGFFLNIGQTASSPYQTIEDRCGALYGLFAETPEAPDRTQTDRIHYERR